MNEMSLEVAGTERRSVRGLLRILAGAGTQAILRLALVAITARFVAPSENGAFQLAISIVLLAMAVGDPGLSEAMVRKRAQSRTGASTFFWVHVALAALLGALLALASGPVTKLLGAPGAQGLVTALAILPLLAALAIAPFVELRRQLRFTEIALIETGACALGCTACVIAATQGGGAWALAAFQFVWFLARLIASFTLAPTFPAFVFKSRALRRATWFSAHVWAARLTSTLSTQLDKIILGGMLGTAALGLYSQGTLFVSVPVQLITAATATALVPSFARLRNTSARIKDEFLQTSHLIAALTLPVYFGAAVLADLLVAIVLGRGAGWDWTPVGQLLAIMAPAGALESLIRPQRALMVARGRSGVALAITFASACILLCGVSVGAFLDGLHGAALGYTAASFLMFAPATALALRHASATMRDYLAMITPALFSSGVMAATIFFIRPILAVSGASETLQLLMLIALGAVTYFGCLLLFGRNILRELWEDLFVQSKDGNRTMPIRLP